MALSTTEEIEIVLTVDGKDVSSLKILAGTSIDLRNTLAAVFFEQLAAHIRVRGMLEHQWEAQRGAK